MAPILTSPSPPLQDPPHYPLERPAAIATKHYALSMDTTLDHQASAAADTAPWPTHPWYSPWQERSSPPLHPDADVDVKPLLGASCAYSSDASLSSESLPRDDYCSYRRDSSISTSSISSLSTTTTSSSSSSSSHSCCEEPKDFAQPSPGTRRACTRRHSTSGGRPHECGFCTRTFARRHDLERHTRVHTGIKPYVCPCCLKAFPRSDARGRHFRNEPGCRAGPQMLAFIKKSIRSTI